MNDQDDPLSDTQPVAPAVDADGECARCHGDRWVLVTDFYVEEQVPGDPDDPQIAARRAAARNTVYPCPACRESLFLRWSNGCLRRDHHASTCERCLAIVGKKNAECHDRAAFPGETVR